MTQERSRTTKKNVVPQSAWYTLLYKSIFGQTFQATLPWLYAIY